MSFEPDEVITSIKVTVRTADINAAGTDNPVFLSLIQPPGATEYYQFQLNGSFERGDVDHDMLAPASYFAGYVMADLTLVHIHKNHDNIYGGWGFGGITIWVNGKIWYQRADANPVKWLEDDDRDWFAPDVTLYPFKAPTIADQAATAETHGQILQKFAVVGGKAPFVWSLNGQPMMNMPMPKVVSAGGTSRIATIQGTGGDDKTIWHAVITVTDALGASGKASLTITTRSKLDPPQITGVDPVFGWRAAPPAAPAATMMTLAGSNFDNRFGKLMKVTFPTAKGRVEAPFVTDPESNSVTVVIPDGAVSGPLQVVTEAGTATSQPVTVFASGYRFTDGYAFKNVMADDNDDGFPNTFAWTRYEEAFGVANMWVMSPFGATVPDPYASIFYLATKDFIDKGCCHGFSLSSLRIRGNVIGGYALPAMGGKYPLHETLFDKAEGSAKPATAVSNLIQSHQLAMLSAEAFNLFLARAITTPKVAGDNFQMDARPMLNDVAAGLAAGWSDPRMIAFAKDWNPTNGHVVVAHAAESGTVHTYNCNVPANVSGPTDDAQVSFTIDTATGKWSYPMGNESWHGVYCFSVPLSAYGHVDHWTPVGVAQLLGTAAILLFSAIGGEGATVEPLAGEVHSLPTRGPRPVHAVAKGAAKFRVTSGDMPALISFMLASGEALSVEEIHGSVIIDLDAAASTVTVTEEVLRSDHRPVVRLVRRDAAHSLSRTFAARAAKDTVKGSVGLGWATPNPVATATVASVDLHSRRVDAAARDDAVELVGVATAAIGGAQMVIGDDGGLTLQAGARAVDLGSARIIRPSGPATVVATPASAPAIATATPKPVFGGIRIPPPGVPTPRFDRFHVDFGTVGPVVVRDPRAVTLDPGRVALHLESDTHMVAVVEEHAGHRSFPRAVLVVPPASGERFAGVTLTGGSGVARSPVTPAPRNPIFTRGDPGFVQPLGRAGLPAHMPLTLTTGGAEVTAVTIDLRHPRQLCGPTAVALGDPAFTLDPTLAAAGAQATITTTRGLSVTVTFATPQAGRVALGALTVSVPAAPGTIWLLRGDGKVRTIDGRDVRLMVVPLDVRCPGPAPGTAFRTGVTGPSRVGEGETIELHSAGVTDTANIGWWVSGHGGRGAVVKTGATGASIIGLMAGAIRVHALIGEAIVSRDIFVEPRPGWSVLDYERKLAGPKTVAIPDLPPRTVGPLLLRPGQLLRDQVWNPGPLDIRVDLGAGVTNIALATQRTMPGQ